MRCEFSEHEWTAIKPMLREQAARRSAGRWWPRARWHRLGSCTQARHGATCRRPMVPARLVTIASSGRWWIYLA